MKKVTLYKILTLAIVNSLTVATAAFAVLIPKDAASTLAATSGYTATWTMTKCRVFTINRGMTNDATYHFALGPGEWKVEYSGLPNNKKITETWAVSGWDSWISKDPVKTGLVLEVPSSSNNNCRVPNPENRFTGSLGSITSLYTTGLYTLEATKGTDQVAMMSYSYPTGWKVTTTVQ